MVVIKHRCGKAWKVSENFMREGEYLLWCPRCKTSNKNEVIKMSYMAFEFEATPEQKLKLVEGTRKLVQRLGIQLKEEVDIYAGK